MTDTRPQLIDFHLDVERKLAEKIVCQYGPGIVVGLLSAFTGLWMTLGFGPALAAFGIHMLVSASLLVRRIRRKVGA